jgi:hypothetical protein
VMLAIWPVGTPLVYALFLWMSRDALRTGVPTTLSRATAFLSGDYKASVWWWEPFEMMRKLSLSIHSAGTRTEVFALAAS